MLSISDANSKTVEKCRFSIIEISKSLIESNRFTIRVVDADHNFIFESDMTGDQILCFSDLQKVFLIDHGILLYNEEIDQAKGSQQRCQIWRSILISHTSELV